MTRLVKRNKNFGYTKFPNQYAHLFVSSHTVESFKNAIYGHLREQRRLELQSIERNGVITTQGVAIQAHRVSSSDSTFGLKKSFYAKNTVRNWSLATSMLPMLLIHHYTNLNIQEWN